MRFDLPSRQWHDQWPWKRSFLHQCVSWRCKSWRISFLFPYPCPLWTFLCNTMPPRRKIIFLVIHCFSLLLCCHDKIPSPKAASRRKGQFWLTVPGDRLYPGSEDRESMVAQAGGWQISFSSTHRIQREEKQVEVVTSMPGFCDILSPARLHLLKIPKPPKQHHQLGTTCLHTCAPERHFSLEPQHPSIH